MGGIFKCSKPIPKEVREKIVKLAVQGVRVNQISRHLKITHGCVSRILKIYYQTNSIEPSIRKLKGKVTTPLVIHALWKYKSENPKISAPQIRCRLLKDMVCCEKNVPSISTIKRTVRENILRKSYE